jgi:hypothetical protein
MNIMTKREFLIFLLIFLFYASQTNISVLSANDASRAAGIESLVEYGTLSIDNSTFFFTIDKAFVNGHFYSDKPPIIILLGSIVYFPLHKIFNLDFVDSNIISYNFSGNSTVLLQPEKNFFPLESWGGNYYKKFFDNATLIYESQNNQEIKLIIPILTSVSPKTIQLYLNGESINVFNIPGGIKPYNLETPLLKLKKGKNIFKLYSGECSIFKSIPCDLHFLAIPKKYNAYFWVTLFTAGLSSSLLMVFFYRYLDIFHLETHFKDLLVFVLGAGSLIITYTLTMTQHPLTALLLFLSFYYILKSKFEKNKKRCIFFSGLFMGLSVISEFYFLIVAILLFVYNFSVKKTNSFFKLLIFFVLSLIIPMLVLPDIFGFFSAFPFINYIIVLVVISLIALTFYFRKTQPYLIIFLISFLISISLYAAFNLLTTGKILPIFFYREFYHYEGSFWLNPTGWNKFDISGLSEPKSIYAFNLFFGHHGIFLITPLLFLSFYSIIRISLNKKNKLRREAYLVLMNFVTLSVLFVFHTANYAGASYGFRWFVPIIPVLLFFLGFFINEHKSNKLIMLLFMILLIISVYNALISSRNPWVPLPETNNFIWKIYERFLLRPIGLQYKPPY